MKLICHATSVFALGLATTLGASATTGCAAQTSSDEPAISSDELRSDASAAGIVYGTPDANAVIAVANDAALSTAMYEDDVRINAQFAEAIVRARIGDDLQAGTADDDSFKSLEELDALPKSRSKDFAALLAFAKANQAKYYVAPKPPAEPNCAARLPRDFAKLQDAIDVVTGTICLDSGSYGDVRVTRNVTIVAPGRNVTVASISLGNVSATASLKGLQVLGDLAINRIHPDLSISLTVDACRLAQVSLSDRNTGNGKTPILVSITNSVLRSFAATASPAEALNSFYSVKLVNNNVFDRGVNVQSSDTRSKFTIANNLLSGSNTVALIVNTRTAIDHRSNAYWQNGSNYLGTAPGLGDVYADPKVDKVSGVPQAGSSLIGAGDPTVAPALDYNGVARAGRIDIGAVQF
jgi:hypothetical protein